MHLTIITPEQLLTHAKSVNRGSFEQTPDMARLLIKRGYQTQLIGLVDEETVLVSAVLFGKPVAGGLRMEIHYGPLYQKQEDLAIFLQQLKQFAKDQHVIELIIKPYDIYQTFDDQGNPTSPSNDELIALYEDKGFQFQGLTKGFETSDWHYLKDLAHHTEQSLLKSYNTNCQRHIKKAKQLGMTVRSLTKEELPLFKAILSETEKRQNFSAKDLDYFTSFYDAFEQADFLVAELHLAEAIAALATKQNQLPTHSKAYQQEYNSLQAQITLLKGYQEEAQTDQLALAVALVTYGSNEATYIYGGGRTAYQKLSAPFFLQHQAMLKSIDRGLPLYNFLGVSGHFDHSDGVLRFKQNFNGYITRCPGEFIYYPNPLKHRAITVMKKILRRS